MRLKRWVCVSRRTTPAVRSCSFRLKFVALTMPFERRSRQHGRCLSRRRQPRVSRSRSWSTCPQFASLQRLRLRSGISPGFLGNARSFLASIPERRKRGVEWARQRGIMISRPRDALLVARRFEAQVRDDQELLLDLLATYGDLIRESRNGRWSIGRALFRGEPVVRTGVLGLRASPVARDFLEALSGS